MDQTEKSLADLIFDDNFTEVETKFLNRIDNFELFNAFIESNGLGGIGQLHWKWRDLLLQKTLQLVIKSQTENESMKKVCEIMIDGLRMYEDEDTQIARLIAKENYRKAISLLELQPINVENVFRNLVCHFAIHVFSVGESVLYKRFEFYKNNVLEFKNSPECKFIGDCIKSCEEHNSDAFIDHLFQFCEKYTLNLESAEILLRIKNSIKH